MSESRSMPSYVLLVALGCAVLTGCGDDAAGTRGSDACYSPCRGGGDCSDEGLVDGCIGDTECREGTCHPLAGASSKLSATATKAAFGAPRGVISAAAGDEAAEDLGKCEEDYECPDHQTCMSGTCRSNCEGDEDCSAPDLCRKKVCRTPCLAGESTCDGDYACRLDDGESGFCMPKVPATAEVNPPNGAFSVVPDRLAFAKTTPDGSFEIHNESATEQVFVVRRVSHEATTPEGETEVASEDGLSWLILDAEGAAEETDGISVQVPANETATVTIAGAGDTGYEAYKGALLVSNELLGDWEVDVTFSGTKDGAWAGNMYFFGANFGEVGLPEWLSNKFSADATRTLGNAFIRRWTAFRDNKITKEEFEAMLTATNTGSWNWASVKERCPTREAPDANTACYMSNVPSGLSIYSEFLPDAPIPGGVVEYPITLNIAASDDGTTWSGKVDSSETLHYPGDPKIEFSFGSDPSLCTGDDETCKSLLEGLTLEVAVGGRYPTVPTDSNCSGNTGFKAVHTPWLVEGFTAGTEAAGDGELRYAYECRKALLPFGEDTEVEALNVSYAATNPIPDGATRRRKIELIDGAMIDGKALFVIFRESMPSFFDPNGDESLSGYGYMWLQRSAASLAKEDYAGADQTDDTVPPDAAATSCAGWIIDAIQATGGPSGLNGTTASDIGMAVVVGATGTLGTPLAADTVHSYCVDTGRFDDTCPEGSRLEWFTGTDGNLIDQAVIDAEACQGTKTCGETFMDWIANSTIRTDLVYACPSGGVNCDAKEFYLPETGAPAFKPLDPEIQDAFRYKTKFRGRNGASVGFAPSICSENASETPYCYDAPAIERILDRVDCAVHIYTTHYDDLSDPARATMVDFLVRNFSYSTEGDLVYDGFERLYAELLVMLGDEAYTSAFSSRFDLAEQAVKTFEGTLFEPGGIDLSGAAGFEMFKLYQAAQYYQAALDRFYGQAVAIRNSLTNLPAGEGFITQATATSYFNRLLRASTQKSRSWAEITKRYQSFHQPALARLTARRAYAASFMEGVIMSGVMDTLTNVVDAAERAQLSMLVEQANLNFGAAMLEMKTTHDQIQDDQTIFGFAPEYVPFPALDPGDTNAFDKAFAQAEASAEFAATKETDALEDSREYHVNETIFQDTLQKIQSDFSAELGEICGTFEVDGMVYPAIPENAALRDDLRRIGNPCGLVGNGALHDAILALDDAQLDLVALSRRQSNLQSRVDDAEARAQEQCDRITSFAEWRIEITTEEQDIFSRIENAKAAIDSAKEVFDAASEIGTFLKCNIGTASDCGGAAAAGAAFGAAYTTFTAGKSAYDSIIAATEDELHSIEPEMIEGEGENDCEVVTIDTKYVVADLLRGFTEIEIDALKLQLSLKLAVAKISELRNEATSALAQRAEAVQANTNLAAAWADPNVRIYKNDVIVAADRSFHRALVDAFKATKVFEYYTAQSYAPMDQLFLIRMVEHGSFPLDEYLAQLNQAFLDFEQDFGNPDTRVLVLSLRDDILDIPRLGADNTALTQEQRKNLMIEAINGTEFRDTAGALSFPFRTAVERLSPRTINHKILNVEAEVVPKLGDNVARVYLVQRGTGVVRTPGDGLTYVSLPERTAVLDVFFEGERVLDDAVYKSDRLRDRPVANAEWLLQIDTVNEQENGDVDLAKLDDVRLYIYYTDFTEK
jgi:hypothetical protein